MVCIILYCPSLHPIPIKVFKKLAGSFIWSLNQVYIVLRTIFVQFIDVYIPLAIQKGTFKTNSSRLMAQATGWTNLVPCTYRRLQKCCCCCWIKEYPLSPVKGSCSMYHQFANLSIALPCPISSNPHSFKHSNRICSLSHSMPFYPVTSSHHLNRSYLLYKNLFFYSFFFLFCLSVNQITFQHLLNSKRKLPVGQILEHNIFLHNQNICN